MLQLLWCNPTDPSQASQLLFPTRLSISERPAKATVDVLPPSSQLFVALSQENCKGKDAFLVWLVLLPWGNCADWRALCEEQHRQALQQAAAQARLDRRQVQQRMADRMSLSSSRPLFDPTSPVEALRVLITCLACSGLSRENAWVRSKNYPMVDGLQV